MRIHIWLFALLFLTLGMYICCSNDTCGDDGCFSDEDHLFFRIQFSESYDTLQYLDYQNWRLSNENMELDLFVRAYPHSDTEDLHITVSDIVDSFIEFGNTEYYLSFPDGDIDTLSFFMHLYDDGCCEAYKLDSVIVNGERLHKDYLLFK